ncbi:MAG: cytochrome c [Sphingomicrobium sp.]
MMRIMMIALATAGAGLAACDREPAEAVKVEAKPVALAYEGAGATDPAAIRAHGKRMSQVLSCAGCHGDNLQGTNVTADDPGTGDMNAPNLTLLLASYSDADLDRVIRHGIPKDNRQLWFMTSETLQFVSDSDVTALVAYLRTVKPAGKPMPKVRLGPKFSDDVAKGVAADAPGMVKRFKASQPVDLGPSHALGRYIAMTTCTQCHNGALQGYEGFTPNLDIAGSYTSAELTTLLTTGEGKVKKDLGLMSVIVKNAYSKLTPDERAAVVAYVKARVDRPQ